MGDLKGGLLVERLASGGLGIGWIAWLTTRRILISLCCSRVTRVTRMAYSPSLWLMAIGR